MTAKAEGKDKPKAAAKATPAADAPTIDSDKLQKDLLAGIRSAVGKVETVQKQSYVRLMKGDTLVGYVRTSKKGVLVQLEARVDSEEDVAAAVEVVQKSLALS